MVSPLGEKPEGKRGLTLSFFEGSPEKKRCAVSVPDLKNKVIKS